MENLSHFGQDCSGAQEGGMCSGCSGDYYGDSAEFDGEPDGAFGSCDERRDEHAAAARGSLVQAESYEVLVSATAIREVRVIETAEGDPWEESRSRRNGEREGVFRRLGRATAKDYQTCYWRRLPWKWAVRAWRGRLVGFVGGWMRVVF